MRYLDVFCLLLMHLEVTFAHLGRLQPHFWQNEKAVFKDISAYVMTAGCGSSRVVTIDAVEAGTSQIIDHCETRRSSKTLSRAPLVAEACDCRFVDAAQSGVNGAACRPIGFV